jgi:hypothetical protein
MGCRTVAYTSIGEGFCFCDRMHSQALHSDLLRPLRLRSNRLLFQAIERNSNSKRLSKACPAHAAKRGKGDSGSGGRSTGPLYITVEKDGSDLWRLDPVIEMLRQGAVSIRISTLA